MTIFKKTERIDSGMERVSKGIFLNETRIRARHRNCMGKTCYRTRKGGFMCGLAGIWGKTDISLLHDMMQFIRHRGPDAEGMYAAPDAAGSLGHCRLSIMDPEGGDQPILNEDSSTVIIANGEIYNFRNLHGDLEEAHRFHTGSDSEVILHLFEERGSGMVEQLDGMFAFAIMNNHDLFLARDPIGIKPLYYGTPQGGASMYFASELKALADYSLDVHEFPPATYFHSEEGFIPYYQLPHLPVNDMPFEWWKRTLRETLEKSVAKRLMSDVPLGAFLSGGLDSSCIAVIARRHMEKLHTFAVGVEGSHDIEAARRVAGLIGSTHHEYLFSAREVLRHLPEIIYYLESFDQDLVRSAIPCFFCSRMASDHVKVVLTGEGSDELFAGYAYYKDIQNQDALNEELHRSVASLHNINLQRVDRMTMAHGIEGRVPFLDLNMIETSLEIPSRFKILDRGSNRRVEKWILRLAFEHLLPPEIIWREKSQFDQGSGTVDLLNGAIDAVLTAEEARTYRQQFPEINLRSAEECFYHKIFMEVFRNPEPILANTARWSERPKF